ncbi:hypothetical protein EAO75_37665 [Streptomyces sp. uw30]|uniref:hypothetical protein n=1 Tax=Streptomyces sp. uw30 TaxID=1828179 RepID=UPI0011CE9258|nr:hypothetical protein [Streptomyces sp. uw30]TXS41632.1 hypothetical protein EAO75_37665 [Streptomyces sp. uw30]
MDPETHRALHRIRAAELHAQAKAHRLACSAKPPRGLRTRLGWTLVELGLRLATPRPPALAH